MWSLFQNDPLSRPNLTAHCPLCPVLHHLRNLLINHNVQHLVKHLVHPSHLVQLTIMANFSTSITLSDNPYDQLVHLLNILDLPRAEVLL